METLKDRLALFLSECNISVQKFERECDMGQGAASKLSIKSYATTFAKIKRAYPELNIEWLKTGNGKMINEDYASSGMHIRQSNNPKSTNYGYVNISVPTQKVNKEGIMIAESEDNYKSIINAKDEQISRLLSMLEEKDKIIKTLLEMK